MVFVRGGRELKIYTLRGETELRGRSSGQTIRRYYRSCLIIKCV